MQQKTKKTWKNRLKRLLLYTGGIFLFLVFIAYCFEGVIGKKIITEVQANLRTELKVGDVNFSLVRSFPYAALDLKNVSIQGTDKQPMLKAATLRFKIDVWSIIKAPIDIKAIVIQDGALLLKTNSSGKNNYDILKPTNEKSDGDVAFILQKAKLVNIVLGYQNAKAHQDLGATIQNASFSGDFSSKNFNLKSNAVIRCHGFSNNGTSLLSEKHIAYSTELQVDRLKKLYTLRNFNLEIEENKFDIQGKVLQLKNEATNLDLTFNATECNIGSLLKIFPQPFLQDFNGDGDFALKGSVKGIYSTESQPNIKADIQLRNGKVSSPKMDDALEKVNFSAVLRFDNQNSFFSMPDFKGYFGNQPLSMTLDLKNLKAPLVDFSLNGKVPLSSTFKLLENPDMANANGFLALQDIHIAGYLEDMKKVSTINKVEMSGAVVAENIVLDLKNENIIVPSGALRFANNNIFIEKVKLDGAGANILFDGNFSNLLPVLLDDSLHQDVTLDFKANLYASNLDIKRFSAIFETPNTSATPKSVKSTTTNDTKKPLISLLNGTFESEIESFSYDKIVGKDFVGFIGFEQDNLLLKGKVETMKGSMILKGRLSMQGEPNLSAIVACNNFDTKSFFEQCNNFGQDVLTTENVSGRMDTKLAIDARWDKNWTFKDKDLYVLAYLNVRDGYMQNMKMLEEFSTYVKIEDLRNIKFTNLENWFEISDKTLRIPVMTIRNNALNMTISGKHSFDDAINYNFKINAANVVVNRFKKFNPKLEPQQDVERNGFFDLYFNMAGTLDQYKIQMSKKIVKADFEESAQLKREIQAKLDAVHNGKELQLPDYQYLENNREVVRNPTQKPLKNKKQNKEDEYEYISGF
jgi:hypothetical protein